MPDHPHISRRTLLGWAAAPLAGSLLPLPDAASAADATPIYTLTVLYRRNAMRDAARLDPAAQSATAALENEFGKRGFRVVQPSPQTYEMLDRGPAIAVSFAPDAGFSMLFSAYTNLVPRPGANQGVAEVILQCRVFVGHHILVSEEARGSMATNLDPNVREFAERRSTELAAQRAAATLAEKVAARLTRLSPAMIEEYSRLSLPSDPTFHAVAVPPESAPPAPSPSQQSPAPEAAAEAPPKPPARKFALVIGVSDYSKVRQRDASSTDPRDLPGVAIDRRNLINALQARGFDREHITVLADTQATSDSVRRQLKRLVATTTPDDLVLIAISAHGASGKEGPSGFGIPVLSDFSSDKNVKESALDFWELQSLVGNMPASQTVLLIDTCHSGGATGMMLGAEVSSRGVSVSRGLSRPDPERIAQVHTRTARAFAVMTASKADEFSLEDQRGGGLFTNALVQALTSNKNEQTLAQLFHERIEQQVASEASRRCQKSRDCQGQTPQFAYSGRGDAIRL